MPTSSLRPLDASGSSEGLNSFQRDPSSTGVSLRISTDVSPRSNYIPTSTPQAIPTSSNRRDNLSPSRRPLYRTSSANNVHLATTPGSKSGAASLNGGGNSNMPSPIISAMGDVTPLPSPLLSSDSPGPWKRLSNASLSSTERDEKFRNASTTDPLGVTYHRQMPSATASPTKRKPYVLSSVIDPAPAPLNSTEQQQNAHQHTRNRSISDYVPESLALPKRLVAVSEAHPRMDPLEGTDSNLRRETNLAESRGLTPTVTNPPTPPPSDSSKTSNRVSVELPERDFEYFKARSRKDQKKRRWRSLGLLGQGTFSRVMLATSQIAPKDNEPELVAGSPLECRLERKSLVAVKVCEHGPRGGASEGRIEMSLKRELEIMEAIHHPSLVDLKAWSIEPTRAILVIGFCPGGDLFDVATTARSALTPLLIRRIFAELVGAVRYLHAQNVVHRDIKLENVLVNIPRAELSKQSFDWLTYPYSVITLADLGLSRRVTQGEQLETRCGSDDYAAPEVIMGQSYDGMATDAWSLGVLLYALLEARLPFDPHPSMSDAHRMRSRTSHRIARVEWRWVEYAGEDGDHEADEAKFTQHGLLDAMRIVEGLLKRARSRWTIEKIQELGWVAEALNVPSGLRFIEVEDGEAVE